MGDQSGLLETSTSSSELSDSAPTSGNYLCLMTLQRVFHQISSDVISYIGEYGILNYLSPEIQSQIQKYHQLINDNDIVIVTKNGCGFCERAKILLEDLQEKFSFTKENLLGTDLKIKNAVGIALNLGDLTYPQIVIRGRYVGGSDDLRELIDSGEFENLLSMNRHVCDEAHSIEWYAPLLLRSQRPELLTIPGGSPYFSNWYFFQGYMYSNLVRYISMVHTIILALCLMIIPFAETGNSSYQFIQVALSLLLIDILGILLIGPSPFSLSGVLSTYLGWKYKGNSTSSLPYKFVWLIYVISLSPYLFENSITSNASIATMTSTLVNSVVLVVFRF